MTLRSTTQITETGEYLSPPSAFFSRFSAAWDQSSKQVRKLETRQEYREPGNESWEALIKGDLGSALSSLRRSKEGDTELYATVRRKNLEFVRCRPVSFPLTLYLAWEIEAYKINSEWGEVVLFCAIDDVRDQLTDSLHHDFMVFDDKTAFVHDYDERGEIRGGWHIKDPASIRELTEMYDAFRTHCLPFKEFLS